MPLREKSAAYQVQLAQMCRKIVGSRVVRKSAPGFVAGANQLLDALRVNQGSRRSFRLALEPNWKLVLYGEDICGAAGQTELHFGGEMVFRDQCLERQVLTVVILLRANESAEAREGRPSLIEDENHVVRRFHFDFDSSVADHGKPLAHMQIGGQLNQQFLSIPEGNPFRYEIFDQLDYPRFPWTIVDLPIVLDMFLRQFPAGLDELVSDKAWRDLVMDSEKLWVRDFFSQAVAMMDSASRREPLYDYCCEGSAYEQ
ncbi:MAG: hypothetical protein OXM03_04440 [Chloroflexota bacterium]|nr:hypothetical protein [Caldilineaceae bacterium]MDE0455173.1 hypothetical protein [Gammaproteobacteria bacterium]MDE2839857.1 hypothetical protein [Chloroflexota bacterium]